MSWELRIFERNNAVELFYFSLFADFYEMKSIGFSRKILSSIWKCNISSVQSERAEIFWERRVSLTRFAIYLGLSDWCKIFKKIFQFLPYLVRFSLGFYFIFFFSFVFLFHLFPLFHYYCWNFSLLLWL